MDHNFKVGDTVSYPDPLQPVPPKNWTSSDHPRLTGVITAIHPPEHVEISGSFAYWHFSWIKPYDEFTEWVKEVRELAGV